MKEWSEFERESAKSPSPPAPLPQSGERGEFDLFYGLANIILANEWINREFIGASTSGFDEFAAFVRDFTPDRVASATGIESHRLHHLAEIIQRGERVSFWWTMGVNQSYQGVRTAQAIINLALMTGNIGRPGTGANSVTPVVQLLLRYSTSPSK